MQLSCHSVNHSYILCRDWHLPVHNFINSFDAVLRLLSDGVLSEAISQVPALSMLSQMLSQYVPIGMCYFMSAESFLVQDCAVKTCTGITFREVGCSDSM